MSPSQSKMPQPGPLPQAPEQILVIRLSALGDVVNCLPMLSALRKLWPNAHFDWLTESLSAPILSEHPDIRELFVLPRKQWSSRFKKPGEWKSLLQEIWGFRKQLRKNRYDLVIDLQANFRSGLICLNTRYAKLASHHLSEITPGERIPFLSCIRPKLASGRVDRVTKHLHLAQTLGFNGQAEHTELADLESHLKKINFSSLHIEVSKALEWFKGSTSKQGQTSGPIILLPFVSKYGKFKEWPAEKFVSLAKQLAILDREIWIAWGPGEKEAAQKMVTDSDGAAKLAPATANLIELAALLKIASVVIGADTGPTHLAAFLQRPVVGLYGPKDPAIYAPHSPSAEVARADIPCSPCTLRRCSHAICMQLIQPETVAQRARALLSKSQSL